MINVYRLRTKTRLNTLGKLLNNFFSTEDNQSMESSVYFYFTNSEGLAILEVNKEEVSYRYGACDDFTGQFVLPRSHKKAMDSILEISKDEKAWEEFKEGIGRKWTLTEYLKMRPSFLKKS